jgi:glyoxylase-like metal-dependent hydrolase (beta-lactamase superfamily II)
MTPVDELATGRSEVLLLDLGEVVLPADHPQGSGALPILAYAVSHAGGVLLFDTGVGEGNAEVDEVYSPRRTEVAAALATHGLSLADVTHVANCHLHFDHVGENARFPQIPIFVQEEEYLACL